MRDGVAELDCPFGESLAVADYVAGRLPESEAEAFEEHLFACPRCAEELELALALRAIDRPEPGHGADQVAARPVPAAPRPRRTAWGALAAAAVVLVLAAGAFLARERLVAPDARRPAGPVYRSAGEELGLETAWREGSLEVVWTVLPGADRYLVTLFTARGEPIAREEVRAGSAQGQVSFAGAAGRAAAGATLYLRAQALDPLGRELAASPLVPVTVPRRGTASGG